MIAPLNSTTHDHMAWGPWGTSASPANARCRVSLRKELRNTGSLVAEKLQSRVERLLSIFSGSKTRYHAYICASGKIETYRDNVTWFLRMYRWFLWNHINDFKGYFEGFLAHLFFFLLLLILLQLPLLVTHIFKVGRCCYVEMPDRIAYVLDALKIT